jgi:hypothetical protein
LNALAYSADEAEAGAVPVEPTPEGQIAAFLPDGRIAITIGATAGLAAGDVLMVFSSDTDSPLLKGELLVDEVREHVSYALPIGDVVPAVGDIVRSE